MGVIRSRVIIARKEGMRGATAIGPSARSYGAMCSDAPLRPEGRLVLVDSGHFIQINCPEVVVAVLSVAARNRLGQIRPPNRLFQMRGVGEPSARPLPRPVPIPSIPPGGLRYSAASNRLDALQLRGRDLPQHGPERGTYSMSGPPHKSEYADCLSDGLHPPLDPGLVYKSADRGCAATRRS
jgi:hypothetical protein